MNSTTMLLIFFVAGSFIVSESVSENSHLRFDWITNCSGSQNDIEVIGEVLVYRYMTETLDYNEQFIVGQHNLSSVSQLREVVVIPLEMEYRNYTFTWRNEVTVNETCCWSIANPIITSTPNNSDEVITEVENVNICIGEQQTYLYNGSNWACSVPGISNMIQFTSDRYELDENGQFNNTLQPCKNSNIEPISIEILFRAAESAPTTIFNSLSDASSYIEMTSIASDLETSSEIFSDLFISIASPSYSEMFNSISIPTIMISEIYNSPLAMVARPSYNELSIIPTTTSREISSSTSSYSETSSVSSVPTTTESSNRESVPKTTSETLSESSLLTVTSQHLRSSLFAITTSTSSVSVISPTVLNICPEDGVWKSTKPNTTVIGVGVCYDGTVNASRYCGFNGEWEDYQCLETAQFTNTLNQIQNSPEEGLTELGRLIIQPSRIITLFQAWFLLDFALETALADSVASVDDFINVFQEVTISIIQEAIVTINDEESRRSLGSRLLLTLDNFILNFVEPSGEVIGFDTFLLIRVLEFDQPTDANITGISVDGNSITLPPQILQQPNYTYQPVRIGSIFFRNLSYLLPPEDISGIIVSPVISSTTDCQLCPTTDLKENVTVQLQITGMTSPYDNLLCVFFQFENQSSDQPTGDWSTSGCTTTVDGDNVTCSCNHLTHFAILLSPGIETSIIHYEILNTIGLVLVPISLVCMILVVLTYTLMKSLWSLRNYIHIMLCVSLFMAQLVFIIGIDKIKNKGACSAVAVILQYLFLVTFMWMLMEGVVLVITLVKVFISRHKCYIIAFTVTSYVVPAVYMAVVIPIGYSVGVSDLPDDSHYFFYNEDQLTACWLNYETGFIWSFIIPVAVLLIVNIVFFVITFIIIRRNSKSRESNVKRKSTKAVRWMQALIPLTLVMGINWLVGILAFREELLFVAYIMTVFIAGQGILLFIILVPLSKQVRDAYLKMWMKWKSRSKLLKQISSASTALLSTSFSNKNGTILKSTSELKHEDHQVGPTISESGVVLSLEGMKKNKTNAQPTAIQIQVQHTSFMMIASSPYEEATVISNPVNYQSEVEQEQLGNVAENKIETIH